MAHDGVLGRDLANRVHQLQNERYQAERFRQLNQGTTNRFPTDRFGQTNQGFPPGKAWGLRGGKPFTGKVHPLNALPNGRAFQDPSTVRNGFALPGSGRGRTIRTLPGYERGGRGFGGGPGRGRGFGRGRR